MPTTIQVDEKTREQLLKYASDLQLKLGRKVTFDEAIQRLLEETKGVGGARDRLGALFGSLSGEKELFKELETTRKKERETFESKARPA